MALHTRRAAGGLSRGLHLSPRRETLEFIRAAACAAAAAVVLTGAATAALADGWFYTGDLARQDAEGYFYIMGRAKDMIISSGENIYPAEVEAVLHTHPAIASASLIGLADSKWGETPVAVVITRPSLSVTAEELIEFCSGRLARYKIPPRVFFVEEFPLSGSGKIAKRALKEEIEKRIDGCRVN